MIDEKIKAEAERRANLPRFRVDTVKEQNEQYAAIFIAGANFGKEMSWVKCSDKTPKQNGLYIVFKPEGRDVCVWDGYCFIKGGKEVEYTHYCPYRQNQEGSEESA